MPVKLTSDGKPLGESVKQAPEPAPTAVDALLDNPPPPQGGGKPIVAHAELGEMGKNGVITMLTSEQIATGFTVPPDYNGPIGKVTYGMAATVNIGNFENVRPFVQIEVPFVPGYQDAVYDYATEWVDKRLTPTVNGIKTAVSGA